MRWRGDRESDNVEDRRGEGGGFRGFPGMGLPIGGRGGLSIGGLIIIGIICLIFGINPLTLLSGGPAEVSPESTQQTAGNDEQKQFVSVVLADTEDVWTDIFQSRGQTYEDPKLVLFSGGVSTACGSADTAAGPFYCPRDRKVYLDLGFYDMLKRQFGAPGDFAEAYVIAHEVGHHVQNLLGIASRVRAAQERGNESEANALSVRLELQADCFAGVWANHADKMKHIIEAGDVDEALTAASAVGDDTLQRRSQGYVVPDSFTHGTSAERVRWFKTGYSGGGIDSCDAFGSTSP
jgi:predicted metalloprotease